MRTFDVVGPTMCMKPVIRAVGTALGWPPDESKMGEALRLALLHRPEGVARGGVLWREARRWQLENLNDTEHSALLAAARRDTAPPPRSNAAVVRSRHAQARALFFRAQFDG